MSEKTSADIGFEKQIWDAYLVECAHQDIIWTCGSRLHEKERFDVSLWRGQNILGFALMEVRRMLQYAEGRA